MRDPWNRDRDPWRSHRVLAVMDLGLLMVILTAAFVTGFLLGAWR